MQSLVAGPMAGLTGIGQELPKICAIETIKNFCGVWGAFYKKPPKTLALFGNREGSATGI
jgi:hypothetical protein